MSAPISPGGFRRPKDTASVDTTMSRAPAACAASAIRVRSVTVPNRLGVCTTTQATSASSPVQHRRLGVHRQRRGDGLDAGGQGQGLDGVGIVGMQAGRQQRLAAPGDAVRHQDGFRRGGRAVVHRGVGRLHAGQGGDLGLELEGGLQGALGDLGLIGRVGGQELRALDQMIDRRRDVMAVGAGAAEEGPAPAGRFIDARRPSARSTSISP